MYIYIQSGSINAPEDCKVVPEHVTCTLCQHRDYKVSVKVVRKRIGSKNFQNASHALYALRRVSFSQNSVQQLLSCPQYYTIWQSNLSLFFIIWDGIFFGRYKLLPFMGGV